MIKFCIVLLLSLILTISASASVLSDTANNLAVGSWVQMPPNASLDALNPHRALLYWPDGGEWNEHEDKLYWMGGPGNCCESPPIFRMITYAEATDTWSLTQTSYTGGGHCHDGNAMNHLTGRFYFVQSNNPTVRSLLNGTWTDLPTAPWGDVTPALTWFPELNGGAGGLVAAGIHGGLIWFDGTTWHTINSQTELWQGYNQFVEYNPMHKVVWVGNNTAHYKLDAALNLTQLSTPPIKVAVGDTIEVIDPASGKYLVKGIKDGHTDWWEYDIIADSWTNITSAMANRPSLGNELFPVAIPKYGVIMIFEAKGETERAFLYRHAPSVQDTVPPGAPADFAIEMSTN